MQRIRQHMGRSLSTGSFDAQCGQITCYIAAILILVLAMWKLTTLQVTEVELFLGLLLTLVLTILCVILGLLLPIYQTLQTMNSSRAEKRNS